eukprot:2448888-Rhodomonas_salina.2
MSGTDVAYAATLRSLSPMAFCAQQQTLRERGGGGEGGRKREGEGREHGGERCLCLVRPEIQYKKPKFQHNLYQECGFLHWISGSRPMLPAYARPMQCPALAYRSASSNPPTTIVLQACYAMSGTDAGYAATRL